MRIIIWAVRLLLTAAAVSFAVAFGLAMYWSATFSDPYQHEKGEDWPDFLTPLGYLALGLVAGSGLLFFGPLAVVAWTNPWRKVLLLTALWAGSTTAAVFAVVAWSELALVLAPTSLFLGWELCASIKAAVTPPPEGV